MTLEELGWDEEFAAAFAAAPGWRERGLVPARVVAQTGAWRIATGVAEMPATLAGRLRRRPAREPAELPAIGDWVAAAVAEVASGTAAGEAVIHAVLPRRSRFVRKAAGARSVEQVVAANVDVVLLVVGLDGDFNLRRLERYLAAAWESGARPVVVLNKADACDETPARLAAAAAAAPGAHVHALSARTGDGLAALAPYLASGKTVTLLGSSGAGKSTLLNRLLGDERQRTAEVRAGDSRGRHTTTHRELFRLRGGGLVIDTPGMRELQLWEAEAGLPAAFADLERLAAACRFADCAHQGEPGCAVEAAVAAGRLEPERLASFRKLGRELHHLRLQRDGRARQQERARLKSLMASINRQQRRGDR